MKKTGYLYSYAKQLIKNARIRIKLNTCITSYAKINT